MYNQFEYIQGKQFCHPHYNPRFCSSLPWTDHTETPGSELEGYINEEDGYNSNACFSVHSYVGGKCHHQELVIFSLDDLLFTESLVLSAVCKVKKNPYFVKIKH